MQEVAKEWSGLKIAAGDWLTGWHPELGIFHLRREEGGRYAGRRETGGIVVRSTRGPLKGTISVRAELPGTGKVRISGQPSPATYEVDAESHRVPGLLPGEYSVRYQPAAGEPARKKVRLDPGETVTVTVD